MTGAFQGCNHTASQILATFPSLEFSYKQSTPATSFQLEH